MCIALSISHISLTTVSAGRSPNLPISCKNSYPGSQQLGPCSRQSKICPAHVSTCFASYRRHPRMCSATRRYTALLHPCQGPATSSRQSSSRPSDRRSMGCCTCASSGEASAAEQDPNECSAQLAPRRKNPAIRTSEGVE